MAALGWLLNLGFAGSGADAPTPTPTPTTPTGGGRGAKRYRRAKYPRRISIAGTLYWVRNAEEERDLLRAHLERLEAEALELALEEAPKPEVAKARVKVVRAARRLEEVDERADEWLARLLDEDEELLLMVVH